MEKKETERLYLGAKPCLSGQSTNLEVNTVGLTSEQTCM